MADRRWYTRQRAQYRGHMKQAVTPSIGQRDSASTEHYTCFYLLAQQSTQITHPEIPKET